MHAAVDSAASSKDRIDNKKNRDPNAFVGMLRKLNHCFPNPVAKDLSVLASGLDNGSLGTPVRCSLVVCSAAVCPIVTAHGEWITSHRSLVGHYTKSDRSPMRSLIIVVRTRW